MLRARNIFIILEKSVLPNLLEVEDTDCVLLDYIHNIKVLCEKRIQ